MSPVTAGLTAGIPLALILGVYVFARGKALVPFFYNSDESIAKIPEKALIYIILVCFIGAAFLFGTLYGWVYGWLGIPNYYYVALGATILLSILTVGNEAPLKIDNVLWNIAVGGVLGILVPIFAG